MIADCIHFVNKGLEGQFDLWMKELSSSTSTDQKKQLVREMLMHYAGNMVVVCMAGISDAIEPECQSQYDRLLDKLPSYTNRFRELGIQLAPQIDEAILRHRHPHMDK